MRRLICSALLFIAAFSLSSAQVKVACIGDSVTYGYGLDEDRDSLSYPAQLQKLMGQEYDVRNFGHNGATLLRNGHRPYNSLPEYTAALEFVPDLAVIHLGLNDTDPRNWPNYSDEFIPDYRALIDDLRKVNPSVKIWICRMTPIFHGHRRYLSGTRDWHARIQEVIPVIAETAETGLIDLFTPLFVRPDLFADNLHPSAEGYGIIAETVYGALTGDYGGLQLSCMYSDDMVLQREKPLTLSGTADAGQAVEVTLIPEVKTPAKGKARKAPKPAPVAEAKAEAAADGKWSVTLPAMEAGGPYVLTIGDREFHNVWVGEVWVCNGQSNMAFMLRQCLTAEEDIAASKERSDIHLFKMTQRCFTDNVAWSEEDLAALNRLELFKTSGWETAAAGNSADFSAIGYHFGKVLADSLGCHVGLIDCAVGGSTTESWCDAEVLRWDFPQVLYNWMTGDFGQEWARGRAAKNIEKSTNKLQRHPYQPCYLFDSAIRKMDRYPVKGLVWYQGESNAHNIETHEIFFRLAVKSWRQWWGEELPVEMIQLSGINRPSWPYFRDSQRRLAETMPGVEMTVCSDLGHPTDVHPKEKRTVGVRAAASALHYFYDMDVVPSGPVYKSMVREGDALRLSFDWADGMVAGKGFEIAGHDGLYHEAVATVDGCTVLVRSDKVPEPCAVRYGWKPDPVDAVLRNAAGIPASTFKAEIKF